MSTVARQCKRGLPENGCAVREVRAAGVRFLSVQFPVQAQLTVRSGGHTDFGCQRGRCRSPLAQPMIRGAQNRGINNLDKRSALGNSGSLWYALVSSTSQAFSCQHLNALLLANSPSPSESHVFQTLAPCMTSAWNMH